MLPQLVTMDSKEIIPTERIVASQRLDELCEQLEREIEAKKAKDAAMTPEERAKQYNPQSRREMYKEIQAQEQANQKEKEKSRKPEAKKPPSSKYTKEGELRQCNEGRYEYKLKEWDDPEWSFFEIPIPSYTDTSQVEFELFPYFISVRIKGKLTQVRLHEEIIVDESKVQRSQTTGVLMVTMKKVREDRLLKLEKTQAEKKKRDENAKVQEVKEANIQQIIDKKQKSDAVEKKIQEDEDLDDLPDLE